MTGEVRFYEDVARVAGEGDEVTGLGGGTMAALRMAGLDPRDVARAG